MIYQHVEPRLKVLPQRDTYVTSGVYLRMYDMLLIDLTTLRVCIHYDLSLETGLKVSHSS